MLYYRGFSPLCGGETHVKLPLKNKLMKKNEYKNSILRLFAYKPILSLQKIKHVTLDSEPEKAYAFNRSIKNIIKAGEAELINSGRQDFMRLTKTGKMKLNNLLLSGEEKLANTHWDGFWRIIILDLPEERKDERDALRYLLKRAGFICTRNILWISPNPYEYLFANIKKDLGLKTELIIIVTNKIDEEASSFFLKTIKEEGQL